MGIAVKQWLNEYSYGLKGTSHETVFIRQYRWNKLMKWQVPIIVDSLSALLQAALALFLIGLIILLWTVHPTVAIVISVLGGLVLAFIFSTLVTSSAIAFLVDRVEWLVRSLLYLIVSGLQQGVQRLQRDLLERAHKAPFLDRLQDCVEQVDETLLAPIIDAILTRELVARRGRESIVVAEQREALSHDMMRWAYTISKEHKFLTEADICLPHHKHPSLVPYYDKVVRIITDRWSDDFTKWPQETFQSYRQLSLDILPIVQVMAKDREEDWKEADKLFKELTWNSRAQVADGDDLNDALRAASLMAASPHSADSVGLFLFTSLDPFESNNLHRTYPSKTLLWGMCHSTASIQIFG